MESAGAEVHLGLQTSQENYPNFCNEIQTRWLLAFKLPGGQARCGKHKLVFKAWESMEKRG